jgi:hypothetical protein
MRNKALIKPIFTAMLVFTMAFAGLLGAAPAWARGPADAPQVAPEAIQTTGSLSFQDLAVNLGSNENQLLFTWYTSQATGRLAVRAQSDVMFTVIEAVNTARGSQYVHKVTVDGIAPSTTYEYALVGDDNAASAIKTITTPSPGSFSFIAVGDPQIGSSGNATTDTNGWKNTLALATANFPGASFLLSAGDQVETASNTTEYAGFLSPAALSNLPMSAAVGNHDASNQLFTDHFSMPNSYPVGSGATAFDYWYTYGNTLFMVLDANTTAISNHRTFMEAAIAANSDVTWKVVMFHQGPYVNASHRADGYISTFRTNWIPAFDQLGIDVVINGHDHSYVRSYQMEGNVALKDQQWLDSSGNIQTDPTGKLYNAVLDPTGTLYMELNSGSGSKYYQLVTEAFFVASQNQANRPNFSIVEVGASSFTITTYQVNTDATITEIDTYRIQKTVSAPEPEATLLVTADKTQVSSGEYFNVNVAFDTEVNTNAFSMTMSYDADKFIYRGFTAPDGYSVIDTRNDTAAGEVTFIMGNLNNYGATALGTVMFSARTDVDLGSEHSNVSVAVEYVNRNSLGAKEIKTASGTVAVKAGTIFDLQNPTLIDLSNAIDVFGLTSADAGWAQAEMYDLNGNGVIDISDISAIARRIVL